MTKKQEYWYPWTISFFRRKTAHLTTFQRGIYRELIDFYMETKEPIINNDMALANIARITPEEFFPHAAVIRAFFKEINDEKAGARLWHSHCESVLSDQAERTKTASENGGKGGRKKGSKNKGEKPPANLQAPTGQDITREDRKGRKKENGTKERKSELARAAAARGLADHESNLERIEGIPEGCG